MQQYSIDYNQTFAVVVTPMAFCILFALAAYHDLDMEQIDVITAFLNRIMKKQIYVQMPTGFTIPGIVCLLKKTLYGLKQSPRF